jgi:hypothetical protein
MIAVVLHLAVDLSDRGRFPLMPCSSAARAIATSLKRAALASHRRKAEPFRSAMSMLNFQINRAGRGLTPERRRTLERAETELRRLFGRPG